MNSEKEITGSVHVCRSVCSFSCIDATVMLLPVARLRGGAASAPVSAAFVSITFNTVAVVVSNVLIETACAHSKRLVHRDLTMAEKWLIIACCTFMAYMAVFLLCGFVPMGYVDGSKTVLDLFLAGGR